MISLVVTSTSRTLQVFGSYPTILRVLTLEIFRGDYNFTKLIIIRYTHNMMVTETKLITVSP